MIDNLTQPSAERFYYELKAGDEDIVTENKTLPDDRWNFGAEDRAKGNFYEVISPDGIHFLYHQHEISVPRQIVVDVARPFIQLNFSIQSNISFYTSLREKPFASFRNYEYNLLALPGEEIVINCGRGNGNENFCLNIVPDLFLQYLHPSHPLIENISSSFEDAITLSAYNLPVTPRIRTILYDILNCPLEQRYKRLYLKAKVIELLLLISSHYEEFKDFRADLSQGLQPEEVARMQLARQILDENIKNPCSLIDLAHQVGTNDNYLKKQFKQVFGQTVYGYVHEVRMQDAKRMLLNEDITIAEVARMTGYKHTHHFVTAFKKYFGYAPINK